MQLELEDVALARGALRGISLTLRGGELTALEGPSGHRQDVAAARDRPARRARRAAASASTARTRGRSTRARCAGASASSPSRRRCCPAPCARTSPTRSPRRRTRRGCARRCEAAALDAGFLDRDAGRLSGGEQARVAIARALTRDPGALLLDEPTASLDPAATEAIERLLRDLAARGLALLVVTHDAAQAERIADHMVRL